MHTLLELVKKQTVYAMGRQFDLKCLLFENEDLTQLIPGVLSAMHV